jgi:hypothetical protein
MSEKTRYEFDGFQIDTLARSLAHHGEPVPIRAIAFELLPILVVRHGQTLTKVKNVSAFQVFETPRCGISISNVQYGLLSGCPSIKGSK